MQAFTIHQGIAVPLDSANVDTDQIIPKQFLSKVTKDGFGVHLFHDWRYLDDAGEQPNPAFVMNQPDIREPLFYWRGKTLVVAPAVNTRLGPWPTMVCG